MHTEMAAHSLAKPNDPVGNLTQPSLLTKIALTFSIFPRAIGYTPKISLYRETVFFLLLHDITKSLYRQTYCFTKKIQNYNIDEQF